MILRIFFVVILIFCGCCLKPSKTGRGPSSTFFSKNTDKQWIQKDFIDGENCTYQSLPNEDDDFALVTTKSKIQENTLTVKTKIEAKKKALFGLLYFKVIIDEIATYNLKTLELLKLEQRNQHFRNSKQTREYWDRYTVQESSSKILFQGQRIADTEKLSVYGQDWLNYFDLLNPDLRPDLNISIPKVEFLSPVYAAHFYFSRFITFEESFPLTIILGGKGTKGPQTLNMNWKKKPPVDCTHCSAFESNVLIEPDQSSPKVDFKITELIDSTNTLKQVQLNISSGEYKVAANLTGECSK